MRILFLTHAFNSLTQRLHVALTARGHVVSVEFDINDSITREAVDLFAPDLVIAPYLRRAIPEDVWRRIPCLIVHPGPPGDRGPSALDWAVARRVPEWGVTVLQAEAEMDSGPVWAAETFPMRDATKGSLYRREVGAAAEAAVLRAVERFESGTFVPRRFDGPDGWNPLMAQADRAIDWSHDDTATVVRKIRAADGFPGVHDHLDGRPFALFDAHADGAVRGAPGALVGRRHHAVCRATVDGAVWITHLKPLIEGERSFKRPAMAALDIDLPEIAEPEDAGVPTWREIRLHVVDGIGHLHFDFYNGAMSADQCVRLERAFRAACARDLRAVVLMGGDDFWSNGLHLGAIEAAESPAEESWANINAMDDLCHAILTAEDTYTVAAMRGNAGAGGVFLALAADRVLAAPEVVLNPHYKNMGNLYGSEYWTYLLPRRVGADGVGRVMGRRLPVGAEEAVAMGLVDGFWGESPVPDGLDALLAEKRRRRAADEAERPLAAYRAAELERMRMNFFGFDPSYHVARFNFIRKVPNSRTPLFIAAHRRR